MLTTLFRSTGTAVQIQKFWIKVAGVWIRRDPYIKVSGTWSTSRPFIKDSGTWK